MGGFTQTQLDNIQYDYGIVYKNYGLASQQLLGLTRGGATFTATKTIKDIPFDGQKGKTKGLQVLQDVNAMLKIPLLSITMDDLAMAIPYATYANDKISMKSANIGVIPTSSYLDNITMFGKTLGGDYKKVTIYSGMNEANFELAAVPKEEGLISMDVYAHWDPLDDTKDLYDIEDVSSISADVTPPTVTTVPADSASGVAVDSNLTATFSEDIREADINLVNFRLIKSTGAIVAGALTYVPATKTATFNPTSNLDASSTYIWTIGGVRDLSGNVVVTVTKTFATA